VALLLVELALALVPLLVLAAAMLTRSVQPAPRAMAIAAAWEMPTTLAAELAQPLARVPLAQPQELVWQLAQGLPAWS